MNAIEINEILTNDSQIPNNLHLAYQQSLVQPVRQFWEELCTMTNVEQIGLIANFVRFRFQVGQNMVGYSCTYLGQHLPLMSFFRGIYDIFLSNVSLEINISPVFILWNGNTQSYSCLYASNNFFLFEESQTISNDNLKSIFFSKLSNLNMQDVINKAQAELASKYDYFEIYLVALQLSILKTPNIIYGFSKKLGSTTCCAKPKLKSDGLCLFRALTAFLDENLQETKNMERKKSREPIMKKILKKFYGYMLEKNIPHSNVFTKKGIRKDALHILEKFLGRNIRIYTRHLIKKKTVKCGKLVELSSYGNVLSPMYLTSEFPTNINLEAMPISESVYHIRAITDAMKFQERYTCHCGQVFTDPRNLEMHRIKFCCRYLEKNGARSNHNYTMPVSYASIQKHFDAHMNFDNRVTLIYTKPRDQMYDLSITMTDNRSITFETTYTANTVRQLVVFLFSFLSLLPDERPTRLSNNIQFLASLQNHIQQVEAEVKNSSGSLQLETILKQRLHSLKDFALTYLSVRNIILIPHSDLLNHKLMDNILWYVCQFLSSTELITMKSTKNVLSEITAIGKKSGFQFWNLSTLGLDFEQSQNPPIIEFLALDKFIFDQFAISLSAFEIKTITQLGKIFYYEKCSNFNSLTLVSPPTHLYNSIRNNCRFGYIYCQRATVSEQSTKKFYLTLDYKKFYLNLLKSVKHMYCQPIRYVKINGTYVREKGLNFNTLANLFFSALEVSCEQTLVYGLRAKEVRIFNFPNDLLIIQSPDNVHVLSFFGCFHHGCLKNCHMCDCISTCSCNFQKNNDQKGKNNLRPRLLKFPCRDTNDYKVMKEKHESKWKQSMEIVQKLKCSRHIKSVLVYTECDLHFDWSSKISDIAQKFGLNLRNSVNPNSLLHEVMSETANATYPLFKHRVSFTLSTLLKHILDDDINAFINVKGSCENHNLGSFHIFSRKANDKIIGTNEIDGILPSSFLSFLLKEKNLNFKLNGISDIYIYPNSQHNIFSEPAKKILDLIETKKENVQISAVLKKISNFFIGSWASNGGNKYRNSILMEKSDIPSVNMRKFQGAFPINENYCIGQFSPPDYHVSLVHMNYNIIMAGRLQFLRTVSIFSTVLADFSLNLANTDGFTCLFESVPDKYLELSLPDLLNQFLKANLTTPTLHSYVHFLIDNVGLNICPAHKNEYVEHLRKNAKTEWMHKYPCCESMSPRTHLLRAESMGKFCIIFQMNQAYYHNDLTNKPKTKSSGITNPKLSDFLSKCVSDEERAVCLKISHLANQFDSAPNN